jgi:hypothetical protein
MWFEPPSRVIGTSLWPWLDHPVSGLPYATNALFRLAFAPAPLLQLNLATYGNSQDRSTKSTLSGLHCCIALQLIVSTRFQVLFHSPSGVLFTFPSRYWFTIGRQVVFSLGRWSSLLPTGFLVSRGTLDPIRSLCLFAYRVFTFCDSLSQVLRLKQSFVTPCGWSATPKVQAPQVWALPFSLAATGGIVYSFSSSGYLDVSVPRVPSNQTMCSSGSTNPLRLVGFPIRTPPDQSLLSAPRGFSQIAASFFGS